MFIPFSINQSTFSIVECHENKSSIDILNQSFFKNFKFSIYSFLFSFFISVCSNNSKEIFLFFIELLLEKVFSIKSLNSILIMSWFSKLKENLELFIFGNFIIFSEIILNNSKLYHSSLK